MSEAIDSTTHKQVWQHIECCMEAGNFDEARIVLKEYEAAHPHEALQLRTLLQQP